MNSKISMHALATLKKEISVLLFYSPPWRESFELQLFLVVTGRGIFSSVGSGELRSPGLYVLICPEGGQVIYILS